MYKRTVRYGIRLINGGIVSVILATFFHGTVANLLLLSAGGETWFVFLGLLAGCILGFTGILVAVAGFLRAGNGHDEQRLLPSLFILIILIALFFLFLVFPFRGSDQPRLHPGETITI